MTDRNRTHRLTDFSLILIKCLKVSRYAACPQPGFWFYLYFWHYLALSNDNALSSNIHKLSLPALCVCGRSIRPASPLSGSSHRSAEPGSEQGFYWSYLNLHYAMIRSLASISIQHVSNIQVASCVHFQTSSSLDLSMFQPSHPFPKRCQTSNLD